MQDINSMCDYQIKRLKEEKELLTAQYLSREYNIEGRDFIMKITQIENKINHYKKLRKNDWVIHFAYILVSRYN